jgi:hypothetical protein
MSYPNPINQSAGNAGSPGTQGKDDTIDVMDETSAYMALIRKNLEYEHHMRYDQDRDMYEEIYETVCDVVCVKRRTIRINGEDYPYELVKSEAEQRPCGVCHGLYEGNCHKDHQHQGIPDHGAIQCPLNHEPLLPAGGAA